MAASSLSIIVTVGTWYDLSTSRVDPFINFGDFELPETADALGGKPLRLDPTINGVLGHAEVSCDLIY